MEPLAHTVQVRNTSGTSERVVEEGHYAPVVGYACRAVWQNLAQTAKPRDALAACTTITDVTPAGRESYTVSTQVRGAIAPWGEIKATSLKRADKYCRSQSTQMQQGKTQTHGVRGWAKGRPADLHFSRKVKARFACFLWCPKSP